MLKQSFSTFERVFITVGTTEFNELICSLDNLSFVDSLTEARCKELSLQIGRGDFPRKLSELCNSAGILYDCYRFKPDLRQEMVKSHLIISHCGAGSILEALEMKKPLIVVVNSSLQGDHQRELSDALAVDGHCLTTTPNQFQKMFGQIIAKEINLESFLKPFPEADYDLFPAAIDSLFTRQEHYS